MTGDEGDLVVRINFSPTGIFGSDVGRRTDLVVANWPTVLDDVGSKMSRFLNELNELNETSRPRPACLSDFARMWRMHDDVRSALASTVPLLLMIDPAVPFHSAEGTVDKGKQALGTCRARCKLKCCCASIDPWQPSGLLHDVRTLTGKCLNQTRKLSSLGGSPSTGMLAAVSALHVCRGGTVTLFGFSSSRSNGRHYYSPSDTYGQEGPHNYTCERAQYAQWASRAGGGDDNLRVRKVVLHTP